MMNIKQLLSITALFTFSAQAMQETKIAEEQQESKLALDKIKKDFPMTLKLLFKALGPKENQDLSEFIKTGLPRDVVLKILTHLKTENIQYLYYDSNLQKPIWVNRDQLNEYLSVHGIELRNVKFEEFFSLPYSVFYNRDTYMGYYERHALKFSMKVFYKFYKNLIKPEEHRCIELDKKQSVTTTVASWIRNHKLQSLAAVSAVAGVLGYAAKKLRK